MTDDISKRLQKVATLKDDDPKNQTYVITGEDHTLGNALNYMIHKNSDVRFAGYSIPHPLENKIMLKIEAKNKANSTSEEIFQTALTNLQVQCEYILKTFETAAEIYKEKSNG